MHEALKVVRHMSGSGENPDDPMVDSRAVHRKVPDTRMSLRDKKPAVPPSRHVA
jgi:hypothetical protein